MPRRGGGRGRGGGKGKRERTPRPFIRNVPSHSRPPGLRGKEIGLYYRNLAATRARQNKTEERLIHLRIPQSVVASIYGCLEKIEYIAEANNIYIPPVKKLEFLIPPQNLDFIPINPTDDRNIAITNINKMDTDVISIKNEPEVIEILDTSFEDISEETKVKTETKSDDLLTSNDEYEKMNDFRLPLPIFKKDPESTKVKTETKSDNLLTSNDQYEKMNDFRLPLPIFKKDPESTKVKTETTSDDLLASNDQYERMKDFGKSLPTFNNESESKVKSETISDELGFFVSNNYSNTPSTSTSTTTRKPETSNEYKYDYDDIITGTFQEKLDECITRGITITQTDGETNRLNEDLKENYQDMLTSNDQYKKMMDFRKTLPTFKKASELLDVIEKNQVVVVSGETGCGKSTQVPQLILDEAIVNGRGANVKVLVTEPRRIAASSLAARVSEERGERIGNSVGYAVRLEAVSCRDRGSIMFVTTGVLLVELEKDQALSQYSHLVLDEVHERDCQIDMAMCMVKQVLQKRKDLKLILMSATIDAESLSKYFDNCPMIHIEGIAYPVKDVYLEDILAFTKFKLPRKPDFLRESNSWRQHAFKNRNAVSEVEKDIQHRASIATWLEPLKGKYDKDVIQQLEDSRIEQMNLELVVHLLKYICRGEPGAVLIFVPGIADISKLIKLIENSNHFPKHSHDVNALHSKLPSLVHKKIFQRPPNNIRKIIVATNIAETSITIDDVVYVVDCGKMKYRGLDVERNFSTLLPEWISKANLRQRRGRAGRCQPGICYHLFTSHRAEMLADRLSPELQRSDLLEEVLAIKRLRLGKAEVAMKMMPAVPAEKTILGAVRHLQQIGALDENETLTPLGWHLARLPVPPAAGKLLVLGSLFGCLDRAASVAAVWGFKDPYLMMIGKEEEVDDTKRNFTLGEPSDHVGMSEAIIQWERCDEYDKQPFAYQNFLSMQNLRQLSAMKRQFADNLKQMGFLARADIKSSFENRNHDNMSLFKAIVAASLYPKIATVRWLNSKQYNQARPMRIKAYTPEDGKVSIHPSSVMATKMGPRKQRFMPICLNSGANWLVYGLKQKSTDLFLLDVTCVYTLPLLFFGDLNFTRAANPDECLISISSLKVCCRKETAQLLFRLRSLLDQVLTSKISHITGYRSRKNLDFDNEVLCAVMDLITAEDEGTQYLGDDDDDNRFDAMVPEDTLCGSIDDVDS